MAFLRGRDGHRRNQAARQVLGRKRTGYFGAQDEVSCRFPRRLARIATYLVRYPVFPLDFGGGEIVPRIVAIRAHFLKINQLLNSWSGICRG
jgi:hypothetical protein